MELVNILKKYEKLHIQIIAATLKMTSCRTMSKIKLDKGEKSRFYGKKKNHF
jgi:hypothetical protein